MKWIYFDKNDENFKAVMSIRNAVFEDEQGAIREQEIDEFDCSNDTIYLLIFDENEPCATGRIARTQKGIKIGRIAVIKNQRGKGTGKLLVNLLCEKAREIGAKEIFVDAQLHAIPFYEGLGFVQTGEENIIDRGIEHSPMVKK